MVGIMRQEVVHGKDRLSDELIAGAGSGFMTRLITQPLDVIKIRFQLQVEPIRKDSISSKYTGFLQGAKCILAEEGLFGLWKGHVPSQFLSIIYGMVQFTTFEQLIKLTENRPGIQLSSSMNYFICGSLAGCVASAAASPFDVIRTRLVAQGEPKHYTSIFNAFEQIMKNEGPKGYYRGLLTTFMQIAPYTGSMFLLNKIANEIWVHFFPQNSVSSPSWVQSLTCGGLAGLSAKTIVYPLDLFKKRLQIQGFSVGRQNFGVNPVYKNIRYMIKKIYSQEKFTGFYKGFFPSLIKAGVTTALYFTFYEQILQALPSSL